MGHDRQGGCKVFLGWGVAMVFRRRGHIASSVVTITYRVSMMGGGEKEKLIAEN